MKKSRKTEALIKNLNMIYKRGYMPSRYREGYNDLHACAVNCFGHACFNLSNKDLKELDPYISELIDFFRDFGNCGIYNYIKVAKERIKQVGLKIEDSSLDESLKENQWKIAYYVMNNIFSGSDLHFMIQGKDGKWSGKVGRTQKIEIYDELPDTYHDNYELCGIYKITNPYVKLEKEEDLEM